MADIDSSDRDLIKRITAGDREAFKTFIERYRRLVSHIAFRMIDNAGDREDICQEIFIKAYRNLKDFKFQSRLGTWIGRVAYNTCVNYLKKMRIPLYDDIKDADSGFPAEPDFTADTSPEQSIEINDISENIDAAIDRLPVRFRTIITLFYKDDMTYSQVGEIMGMPEGTVKSYLFRARKLLKKNIMSSFEKEDIYK